MAGNKMYVDEIKKKRKEEIKAEKLKTVNQP